MITTVIFDLDYTLYDEIDFCRSRFRAAASRVAALSDAHSAEVVLDTLWKRFLPGMRGSTFNLALAELGVPCDPPLTHKPVELYRAHADTGPAVGEPGRSGRPQGPVYAGTPDGRLPPHPEAQGPGARHRALFPGDPVHGGAGPGVLEAVPPRL
jgi:hypothetical protein